MIERTADLEPSVPTSKVPVSVRPDSKLAVISSPSMVYEEMLSPNCCKLVSVKYAKLKHVPVC